MIGPVDRSRCRWRGHDMRKLERALETGEQAFKMEPPEPTNATCPVCGHGFMTNPKRAHECCSLSCAGKMKWIRRKA